MFNWSHKQQCKLRDTAERTAATEREVALLQAQREALQEELRTMLDGALGIRTRKKDD